MRRVIIVGNQIHLSNSAATARIRNYMESLSRNNNMEVYLVSFSEDDLTADFKKEYNDSNIFVLPETKTVKSNISTWQSFRLLERKIPEFRQSAVIFYPQSNPRLEMLFLLWAKLKGVKSIYCEINEVRRYWSALPTFGWLKRMLYKTIFAFSEQLPRHYRGLICINHNIRDYFSRYNSNTLIIPILSPINHIPTKKAVTNDSKLRIVFSGSIDIEKENLEELFGGLSLFDKEYHGNWVLELYGFCQKNMINRVKTLAEKNGIADKVFLKGGVARKDLFIILANADCLVLPRQNNKQNFYGFSTKLSEYLISETPVILTRTGVVEDYLRDGKDCIFVNGYDAIGFYEAFNRFVILNTVERNRIGKNAIETAKQNFAPDIYSQQFADFLFPASKAN